MTDPVVLSKANPLGPGENYDLLRREGIKHIEKLSGNIWTDYNTHDPGITLLEALCYPFVVSFFRIGANRIILKYSCPFYPLRSPNKLSRSCVSHYRDTLRFLRRIINSTSAAPAAIQMIACSIVLFMFSHLLS